MASGIPEIDAQHRRLVALANTVLLHHGLSEDDKVEGALAQLRSYVETHFTAEERWMQSLGYATTAAHAREHQSIKEHVDELWHVRSTISADMLFQNLMDWIVHHVVRESDELQLIALCG